MRICIVNTFYYPDMIGGAERCVVKLAEDLYKDGYDVHVICTSDENKDEIINGVNVHRIKVRNFYSPIDLKNNSKLSYLKLYGYKLLDIYNIFNYRLLMKTVKKINPSIVHVNNLYGFSIIVWSILAKIKIPWVQTVHDYGLLNSNESYAGKFKEKLYRLLSQNIPAVISPSIYTLNKFKDKKFFINSQLHVINNGIEISEQLLEYELNIKKEYIQKTKKKKFVFLGRLEKVKGIENLIEAFKSIKSDDIELIIAGKGSLEEEVKLLISNDSRIKYIGFINEKEIDELLRKTAVLVIPSLWEEPFGMVILEAYKYAIPVIGSDKGGIPEVIADGYTGRLFNPNNINELADLINYFNINENIIDLMDNCMTELKKFDWNKKYKETISLYELLINQHTERGIECTE